MLIDVALIPSRLFNLYFNLSGIEAIQPLNIKAETYYKGYPTTVGYFPDLALNYCSKVAYKKTKQTSTLNPKNI